MIDPNLISDTVPPCHTDDTLAHVWEAMQEYKVSQMPVLEGQKYAGVITIEDISGAKGSDNTLKSPGIVLRKAFVHKNAHIFDVLRVALDFNVRIVPVVDPDNNYLGLISAESCMRAFALMNSIKDAGAVLELEVPFKDYTLSEVSRIVEENECRILCLYSNINQHDLNVQLTIKVNTTEVAALVASFERYEYIVKAVHNDTEYSEGLKDRYDSFMRYLNV